MTAEVVELAKTLGPLILAGSFLLGVAAVIKSRAEAVKIRKEADKTEAETLALPDEESLSAKAMKEAINTIREIAADANASRERAEQSEERMRIALERARDERSELWLRIQSLEQGHMQLERKNEANQHRITRLETKLSAARDIVVTLVAFIKRHTPPGVAHPTVDYSIFDR